jgi:hypothetical protein
MKWGFDYNDDDFEISLESINKTTTLHNTSRYGKTNYQ